MFCFVPGLSQRLPTALSVVLKTPYHGSWQCFFQTALRAGARWGSISLLPKPELPRWHWQPSNPPHHGPEQTARRVEAKMELHSGELFPRVGAEGTVSRAPGSS